IVGSLAKGAARSRFLERLFLSPAFIVLAATVIVIALVCEPLLLDRVLYFAHEMSALLDEMDVADSIRRNKIPPDDKASPRSRHCPRSAPATPAAAPPRRARAPSPGSCRDR